MFSGQAFTFRCAAPAPAPAREDDDNVLCEACMELDLEQSFAAAFALYEGARSLANNRRLATYCQGDGPVYLKDFYYVTSLGDRLSRKSDCKLCAFLRQMTTEPAKGTYKLLAFCSSESYLFEVPKLKDTRGRVGSRPWWDAAIEHNVFMAVVPEVPMIPKTGVPLRWLETELPRNGSIYRMTQPRKADRNRVILPRELQPEADFDVMYFWLNACRAMHNCCAPEKPVGVSLRGFRVINCTKDPPMVEKLPWSEKYVALSYVWGPPSVDWSQTILDAVEVTTLLGEQYLWVDRICIDESNLEDRKYLISNMDAIYDGAEFTIVAAAGDARTGLPGVTKMRRKSQPRVELTQSIRRSEGAKVNIAPFAAPEPIYNILGVREEEYRSETINEHGWLDIHRFGLRSKTKLDCREFLEEDETTEEEDLPDEHLQFFQRVAEDFGTPFDEHMAKMEELARRMGIPLRGLFPHFQERARKRRAEKEAEAEVEVDGTMSSVPAQPESSERPNKSCSNPKKSLPFGKIEGKTILLSVMQDPRITICDSEWATRGWTYQEGVLSNRRLVFTEEQVYWECRGMAVNETVDFPMHIFHGPSGTRMEDYMLSGIFETDMGRVSELRYGFELPALDQVGDQIKEVDGHIRAFTSRRLTYAEDSLNAFAGIAAVYSTDQGLSFLLGIPVLTGRFADGRPGLQHTFALSVSAWMHTAKPVEDRAEMYVADCPRRGQFPSWTWAGWQGQVSFSANNTANDDDNEAGPGDEDTNHSDYFEVLTSKDWVTSVDKIWSAEMTLHDAAGTESTMLTGCVSLSATGDPEKAWLLTIRDPLVLRHMYLMHSINAGEWRRLMGKLVQVHLSVPMTEAELTAGHKSGELTTVLVFASTVPYIWDGVARFMILRKADGAGTRWERIGRLSLSMAEWEMEGYGDTEGMIAGLPVRKFGRDITLI